MTAFDYSTPVFSLYNSSGISGISTDYREETDITLPDIVANLSLPIDQVVQEVLFSILQKCNKYLLLFLINLLHT